MTENKMSWRSVRRGLRSCFILSKAQLRNQFRLNAVFGKNASGSGGRTLVMTLAFALLGGMIAFYAYFLAWGMLELGLGQAVPGYALAGASITANRRRTGNRRFGRSGIKLPRRAAP